MLEQFLAGLDVLRRDLASVPAHGLAVMHVYDRGGATWSQFLAGTGDRTIHLFTTDQPARRDRAMASVPIGREAPAPAGEWTSVVIVFGDLTPGSACGFEIEGRVIYPVGPLRPSVLGRRWRERPR